MDLENKTLKLKVRLMYLLLFGSTGCYYPFIAVYFASRNLNYIQIGLAFAANSLIAIIAQPVWGYLTDKYLSKKKTLMIAVSFCALLIFLFILADSFYMIIGATVLLIIFQSVTQPISDSYTYEMIEKTDAFNFGEVRLMGSAGFALAAVIVGKIIQETSIHSTFMIYSLLFILMLITVRSIPFEGNGTAKKRASMKDVSGILKNFRFILMILSVMLASIALGANSSYIAVLIEKTGGSVAILGLVWFVLAFSELPAFFFGNHIIRKLGELNAFIIAMALFAIRFGLCAIEQGYASIIIIQLMQGISFPLFLMGGLQYMNKVVPEQIRATGITLLSSLGFGLGSLFGNLGGGILLDSHSIFFLYAVISCICLLSMASAFFLKFWDSRNA